MNKTQPDSSDPRVQKAVAELQAQIRQRYPQAEFAVVEGEDPDGTYLKATVDIDDLDEVLDQDLLDKLYEVQVEQYLPVYVIPLWPRERVAQELAKRKTLPAFAHPQSP